MEFGFGIYRRNSIILLTCILCSTAVYFLYLISISFRSPPAPPPAVSFTTVGLPGYREIICLQFRKMRGFRLWNDPYCVQRNIKPHFLAQPCCGDVRASSGSRKYVARRSHRSRIAVVSTCALLTFCRISLNVYRNKFVSTTVRCCRNSIIILSLFFLLLFL